MLYEPSKPPSAPHIVESTPHASRQRAFFVMGALLAATIAALSIRGTGGLKAFDLAIPGTPASAGQGTLRVAGTTYQFVTDNCVVTEDEFIAAGTGSNGGEPFRVAASISSIELAFGTSDELSEPASDQLWLQSEQPPAWTTDGQTVTANVNLLDPLDPQSAAFPATLKLICPDSSG